MKTGFDRKAEGWDTEYRIRRAKIIADAIAAQAQFRKSDSVLEFGCGTGLISFNLIDKFDNLMLVDSSQAMLDKAKEKIEAGYSDKKISLADSVFTLADASYDCVYSSMVLHHIKDLAPYAAAFSRILKTGGRLCIADLMTEDGSFHSDVPGFDGHNGFDPEELSALFAARSFTKTHLSVIYTGTKTNDSVTSEYSLFLLTMTKTEAPCSA